MMASDDKSTHLPTTVASKVAFTELCGLLEKISRTTGNDKKKKVLKEFVDRWRELHNKLHTQHSHGETTDSFYPCMRLLLPQLEKERVAYGIKENLLAKLLIEVLCLGKESSDALKLLHYKSPKSASVVQSFVSIKTRMNTPQDAGDFASVAYFVLKNRCPERGSLTIDDVNRCLDEIATNNTTKKKDLVRRSILYLLKNLSALEQKWLIRMIVKDMKIGLSQASVLSVYHVDAEEFYNVNNNLEKVCRLMMDPTVRLHEIGISVFSPFTPMLGERGTPDKIEELMDHKPYYIETKYDGERMLLHKKGSEYKYYTRSGNDYTHVFGGNYLEGTLTPYIANIFLATVDSCILDGEMLGYHSGSKTFGTKAERFEIKSRDVNETSGYEPCLYVFDILLYNNQILTNLALKERVTFLDKVFTPLEGRILMSGRKDGYTNQDCVDALNTAIDNREEGIMVKNPESVYRPNTRKGGWLKVKPEYVGGLMDELDVLIVGGYFGVGHRSGVMSHFLCAVAVPPSEGDKPQTFHSFCKVGSGYSKKELYDYNQRLVNHWNAFDKNDPPQSIVLASGFKEKPDAWIEPSKSFIIQIKATEITDSDRYKCGCTLRFPRVERVRHDKHWYECMTTADIMDLRQKSGGKLVGQRMELGGEEIAKKKRRISPRFVKPTLAQQFKGADVSAVQQTSKMLEGKEICVMNGSPSLPKNTIEMKIVEFGGTFVQNPSEDTWCVLADKVTIKVKNLMKKDVYDIVKVDWFASCSQQQRYISWRPGDMIHARPFTQLSLQQDYDQYGDSYYDDSTVPCLRRVFENIHQQSTLSTGEIAELEDRYFSDNSYGLFRTCVVYVDRYLRLNDDMSPIKDCPLDVTALDLRFYGATVASSLHDGVSHVLVHDSDFSRLFDLRKTRSERRRKFHIVTERWVEDCLRHNAIQTERLYEPE